LKFNFFKQIFRINKSNKIAISSKTAAELLIQNKPLLNFHVIGKLDRLILGDKIEFALVIKNCIIDDLDLPAVEFFPRVELENSIFNKCQFYAVYFYGGLTINNCIFENELEFEAGGHNGKNQISIVNSHFKDFVNFSDCWFQSKILIEKNIFDKGTNILGLKGQPDSVQFDEDPIIQNNKGRVDLSWSDL
jgi:hypothetical protein